MAAKKRAEEVPANTLGWMITFSDMVTLLLTFFVLLLSMCSLEAGKLKQLQVASLDAMGVLLEGKYSEAQLRVITSSKRRIEEKVLEMENVWKAFPGIKMEFLMGNERGNLRVKELERGLSIIMKSDLLFGSGKSEINPEGISVLREISNTFKDFEGKVIVEGHTDNVSIHTERFPSNWELSIARAVSVVRYLAGVGVRPEKMSAAGYADTKPIVPNDTPENRNRNRRIEIFLVSQII